MNLAALVQNQILATLLDAIQPASLLAPGRTVAAKLVSVDGAGLATAEVEGVPIALQLAGPQARQAVAPGATLILRIDAAPEKGGQVAATLLEIRPPAAGVARLAAATSGQPPATAELASRGAASPANPVPPSAPSPRAIAAPLLGPALANQDSLAPLFANLRAVAGSEFALALPRPVLALIDKALAQAVPADRQSVTAGVLREAVARSGVFLEARQAQSPQTAAPPDLKASLQALREGLSALVVRVAEPTARAEPTAANAAATPSPPDAARPAPPRRDGPLQPQAPAEATLSPGDKPVLVAGTLLEQTESALDRITLSQFAALPPDTARADQSQTQRWLTELPLAFQSGAAVLPLRIEKEPPRREPGAAPGPLWRVRFALDVEPIGPLQGVVTLQGRSVGVTLWAEREETSRMLRAATPDLEAALAIARFENGAIDVHTGQPRVAQATAGQFLDRLS